jgi:hypothetical protein
VIREEYKINTPKKRQNDFGSTLFKIYTETDYKKQHKIHQTLRKHASAGRMSQLPSAGQQLGSNRVGKNRKETHGQKQNARTSLQIDVAIPYQA